jgi:hypothetical protein
MKGVMVFTGTGPLLFLISYPTITDSDFIKKMKEKGIKKFIACEIPIDLCENLYGSNYYDIVRDLREVNDMRVLDYDGHRILNNFSLKRLGFPYIYEEEET